MSDREWTRRMLTLISKLCARGAIDEDGANDLRIQVLDSLADPNKRTQ